VSRWSRGPSEAISTSARSASRSAEDLRQADRAGLLRGLDHDLQVEPQPSPLGQHRLQRQQVDQVLALVVGRTAAVEPFALLGEPERREPRTPLGRLPADGVAVAVGQHGGQPLTLDPRAGQHRAVDCGGEAERVQPRLHRLGQVAAQLVQPPLLALGLDGDESRELASEAAVVEQPLRAGDGGIAAHAASSATPSAAASPQGDMISVQPVFRAPSRITPAGQAKAKG
jgi:hypothetical protein